MLRKLWFNSQLFSLDTLFFNPKGLLVLCPYESSPFPPLQPCNMPFLASETFLIRQLLTFGSR
ncbi:hypothetical protein C0J52_21355 [Blattella germanica]|nr:hypothetical protein C0J52_21355 [Blattella germanica]